eukprot:5666224-Pyramimonas_sp.AAC.1
MPGGSDRPAAAPLCPICCAILFPQGIWQSLRANQTGPLGQQPIDMIQGHLRILRTSTWGAQEIWT